MSIQDNLFVFKWKTTAFFLIGRLPQLSCELKTTLFFLGAKAPLGIACVGRSVNKVDYEVTRVILRYQSVSRGIKRYQGVSRGIKGYKDVYNLVTCVGLARLMLDSNL